MVLLTTSQLQAAVSACGYSLDSGRAPTIANQINADFYGLNEAAMLLAHLIHESGGFVHREEEGKGAGQPYGKYYGRGFIQLTWDYNYRAASMALFRDDRLVNDPDMVSRTDDLSMRVSVWFWISQVRPKMDETKFGTTTKVINGGIENVNHPSAKQRYSLYLTVANVLGVRNPASEDW